MNTAIKNRNSFRKQTPGLELSIIIVNYNVKYFLEQCLCSVLKVCKNIEAEILVVDNDSTDGSKVFFANRFAPVKFIWNNTNAGFAKANNLALAQCSGAYVLFLNPDTILPEDCLEKCLAFIKQKEKAGALGIRMIDGSGRFLKESKRGFPSPLVSFFKLSGLTGLFPQSKFFARYYLGHLDENTNHEVDVLAGAFMLIPKKVLETVGSFDEIFFMYGEDIDLSYRIQQAGFKNYYFADSAIIHFKGESTNKNSIGHVRTFYKAMSIFVKKHYSSSKAAIFNLLVQAAIAVRATFSGLGAIAGKLPIRSYPLNKKENKSAVIVSSSVMNNTLVALMESAGVRKNITSIDTIETLRQSLKTYQPEEIIFCEGAGLTFEEIIDSIQRITVPVSCLFYTEGCSSIIGSGGSIPLQ